MSREGDLNRNPNKQSEPCGFGGRASLSFLVTAGRCTGKGRGREEMLKPPLAWCASHVHQSHAPTSSSLPSALQLNSTPSVLTVSRTCLGRWHGFLVESPPIPIRSRADYLGWVPGPSSTSLKSLDKSVYLCSSWFPHL